MRGRADTFSKKSRRTVPRSNFALRGCVPIRSRFVKCGPWFIELTFPRLLKSLTFKPLLGLKLLTGPVDKLQNRRWGVTGHNSMRKSFLLPHLREAGARRIFTMRFAVWAVLAMAFSPLAAQNTLRPEDLTLENIVPPTASTNRLSVQFMLPLPDTVSSFEVSAGGMPIDKYRTFDALFCC